MNRKYLQQCLYKIEEKLGWGPSSEWMNQEFQLLSDRIFEETKVRLSITTLKRVWGRVSYTSDPSVSTLNTLAQFLAFENWNDLKQNIALDETQPAEISKKRKLPKAKLLAPVLVVLFSILILVSLNKGRRNISSEEKAKVQFSSKPVSLGLPNSVVFNYDYADIEADSCAIQLSWNQQMTIPVKRENHEATGIYYFPGYFRAKLIADGQILKEHDVLIKTDGWMATIGLMNKPRYIYKNEMENSGSLKLKENIIAEYSDTESPWLSYFYFNDLKNINGDDFTLETRFKNTYQKSNGICQKTGVSIHGTEGVFMIPFSIPGCISDLGLMMVNQMIDGKSNDLSAFGTNISEWQNLKCTVSEENVDIYLNNKLIRSFKTDQKLGKLVGLSFRFEGNGEVDKVVLSNSEGTTYSEEF